MYLLKTYHAPGEHLVRPFLSTELYLEQNEYGPLGKIMDLDLVVSNQENLNVSIYKSLSRMRPF